jgi:hypothetical protein
MNEAEVSDCELLQAKLAGLHEEVLALSKKSPTDSFNKFKLSLANGILAATNGFLASQKLALPVDGFRQFDEDTMPSNSDVVMVVSQYRQCLEKARVDNIKVHAGAWNWVINGQVSQRRTPAPRNTV